MQQKGKGCVAAARCKPPGAARETRRHGVQVPLLQRGMQGDCAIANKREIGQGICFPVPGGYPEEASPARPDSISRTT